MQSQLHSFWTPPLEAGDWSVTRPGQFAPQFAGGPQSWSQISGEQKNHLPIFV